MLADPAHVAPNFSAAAPAVEPITPENGYFGRVTPLVDDEPAAPLFRSVATAPAKTADEALAALAAEVVDLAAREEAAFDALADVPRDKPEYATLSAEAGRLEEGMLGRLTMAALVWADTPAGLAAKGRAVLAYRKTLEGCVVNEAQPLLLSMAEDAVRLATPALGAEADAAVIALAKRVGRLARMELRAFGRVSELEDKVDDMLPGRPDGAEAQQAAVDARRAALDAIGGVLAYPSDDPVIQEALARGRAASDEILDRFRDEHEEWEADRAKLLQEVGVEAAAQRQARLGKRLEAWGTHLADMRPRTFAGCVAMADAAEAVAKAGLVLGWGADLHQAIVRAVSRLRRAEPARRRATTTRGPLAIQAAA